MRSARAEVRFETRCSMTMNQSRVHGEDLAPALSLFDLDGVLTHGDTTAALVMRRLLRRPHRLLAVAPLALAASFCSATSDLRPWLHRAIVAIGFGRISAPAYDDLVASEADQLARRPGFRNQQAEAALRAAAARGDVVVVTAAEHALAEHYLRAAGLPHVRILASEAAFTRGRFVFSDHNVGVRKLQRVREAGLPLERADLYTDSLSDLPLAQAVHRCVLVNASSRRLAKAKSTCRWVVPIRWI
jgi:phosphoserine phosphatase